MPDFWDIAGMSIFGSTPFSSVLFVSALLGLCLSVEARLTISSSGKPRCVIVCQDDATAAELHAAKDLAHTLKQITGAEFSIINQDATSGEPKPGRGNCLLVGQGELASKLFPEVDFDRLGPEELVIRTKRDTLLLAGGRPRGTTYAVNRFLQQECGVRWWTPWATNIPKRRSLSIGDLNIKEKPAFEYRAPFWFAGFEPAWKSHNCANDQNRPIPAELGGCIKYKGFAHTFYQLVPPDKHFEEHPEWFSMIKGKRTHEHAQLCLTNPKLRDFTVEQVKAWLRSDPDAQIISVTQNDWYGFCECPDCKALDEAEGSHSATMISFVNYIADKIAPDFPHVAVDTFAYQYTRKPPKTIRPRQNVIVRLCSIECNFREPLSHPSNASFRADIEGWSKMCSRLYIWDYTTDFKNYINPHPNWFTLGPNVRFFQQYGVKGVFEQGAYQGYGAEMAELRAWVLAQLLWNPQLKDEDLIREFLGGYFGKAAKPVYEYLELMHEASRDFYLGCFLRKDPPHLRFETLAQAENLWQRAEELTRRDPELLQRVRIAHLPVCYAWLSGWEQLRSECKDQHRKWPISDSRKEVAKEFAAVCKGVEGKDWTQVRILNEQHLTVDSFLKQFQTDPVVEPK